MNNSAILAALALVGVLVFTSQLQCTIAQENCRSVTSDELDPLVSICRVDNILGVNIVSRTCCTRVTDFFNSTCLCSHLSPLVVPNTIRTAATDYCRITNVPQILPQCPALPPPPPPRPPPPSVVPLQNCSRATILTPEELEPLESLCRVNTNAFGEQFVNSRCCVGLTFWSNLTCLCTPLSEHNTPDALLTAAAEYCGVANVPRVLPECHVNCTRVTESDLQGLMPTCQITRDASNNESVQTSCCRSLTRLMNNANCLCSSLPSGLVVPPNLSTAASFCGIDLTEIRRCQEYFRR